MTSTLTFETLAYDTAGLPYSTRYGDRYASRAGAQAQARHVFLDGNGLPRRWAGRRQFVIVETGFGLGNNFLACWQAWRNDPQRPHLLHFVSLEKHPLRPEDLAQVVPPGGSGVDEDPGTRRLRAALAAQWPMPLAGLHRLSFDGGRVQLTLALGDARDLVTQLALGADAYFLDGFAPERNPQMWEPNLLRALARLARPHATVATYSVAGAVRAALTANGFTVQRVPGFGTKRHMLKGQFAPRWKMRRHEPPAAYAGERRAVIVGAGLAGCASALALARRGWHITLLDRGAGPGAGASGLPAGLVYPLLSADDNIASRLSRAAYAYALRALAGAANDGDDSPDATYAAGEVAVDGGIQEGQFGPVSYACGVFQQALDDAEEAALRERFEQQHWPHDFARYEDAGTAQAHLGIRPRRGGVWFPGGTIVHGGRWCAVMLAQARKAAAQTGGTLDVRWHCTVTQIAMEAQRWHAQVPGGDCHGAPVMVLANAADLATLTPLAHAPLQALAGELTLLEEPALGALRAAVGGDGYAIPPLLGAAAVGATYETTAALPGAPAANATAENLQRLQQLLAQMPSVHAQGSFRAHRCVSPDRLPLVGALCDAPQVLGHPRQFAGAHLADLPRMPGMYCLAALGSRGLTLAPLLGELLAALISGEPAPVETALCAAVDPARFVLRHLRAAPDAMKPEPPLGAA